MQYVQGEKTDFNKSLSKLEPMMAPMDVSSGERMQALFVMKSKKEESTRVSTDLEGVTCIRDSQISRVRVDTRD